MSKSSIRPIKCVLAVAIVAGLGACAAPAPSAPVGAVYPANPGYPAATYPPSYPVAAPAMVPVEYGRVTSVDFIRAQAQPNNSPAGAIIGGIAGAVIGNQIGHGGGRDLATVAGGVGGAFAGNAIQKNANANRTTDAYRVSVQVDNGSYRAYDMASPGELRAGDRLRIENGVLYRL